MLPVKLMIVTALGLGLGACSEQSGAKASEGAAGSGSAGGSADARARLAYLERALAATSTPASGLPACAPKAGVHVLSASTAAFLTSGATDGVPTFARPKRDDFFWRKLGDQNEGERKRGADGLRRITGLALFYTEAHAAPVVAGQALTPGRVRGRLVGVDLEAKPVCADTVEVSGPTSASALVDTGKAGANPQANLQQRAEEGLQDLLERELARRVTPPKP